MRQTTNVSRRVLHVLAMLATVCGGCAGGDGPGDAGPGDTGVTDGGMDADVYLGPPAPVTCTGAAFDADARMLLWGDLHVHTSLSFDAYYFNALNDPERAYAYARGTGTAAVVCDDWDQECGTRTLTQPLDFVALTDHSEFLGTFQSACDDPGQLGACNGVGNIIRDNIDQFVAGNTPVAPEVINLFFRSPDPARVWNQLRRTADENYAPCSFTTLHGYEFSPQILSSMMHRNVIFIGDQPAAPVSSVDDLSEWSLFDTLEATCGDSDDCDYLTIPHNSNRSSGRMFRPAAQAGRGGAALTAEDAALRARADVLVEITQHKGNSECMPRGGFDGRLGGEEADQDCSFESVRIDCTGAIDDRPDCLPPATQVCTSISGDPTVAAAPEGCTVPNDMARVALLEGMRIERELGVNPYSFGFVGGTDTHNGTPGAVDEAAFTGHGGVLDNEPEELLGRWACAPDDATCGAPEFDRFAFPLNPGGLTAVYTQQNTREGIFAALRARRTYATSGPRITVRTYATRAALGTDPCAALSAAEYDLPGVPMGSAIPSGPLPPQVVVWAAQAPGDSTPGAPLERIQVVKGWTDALGQTRVEVFDIAGTADGPAPNADCSLETAGRPEQLCGTWSDPSFEPTEDAFYYVRVLEQPTCRWSSWWCANAGVECSALNASTGRFDSGTGWAGYEGCCAIEAGSLDAAQARFDVIQERAWTSPFQYEAD